MAIEARRGALGSNILGTEILGGPNEIVQYGVVLTDTLAFEDEPVLFAAFTFARTIGRATQIGVLVTT